MRLCGIHFSSTQSLKRKTGPTIISHAFARNISHGKVQSMYFPSKKKQLLSKYQVKYIKNDSENKRTFQGVHDYHGFQEIFGQTYKEIQLKVLATLGSLC